MKVPAISVIVVTFNPQWYVFRWALDSLSSQTLDPADFEVIIVDNNSSPGLDEHVLVWTVPLLCV